MKKLLSCLTVALILSLSLFSCGGGEVCDSCTDSDGDGLCDVCGNDIPNTQNDLALFVDGEPTFNIVMADDASPEMKTAVRSFQNVLLRKLGVSVTVALESKSTEAEVEVLVGNVRSRGAEYTVEEHTLGSEGYVIKLIGTKIVINGGSPETQLLAFEKFTDDIIGINSAAEIIDITMKSENSVEEIQTDFNITSLKIDGVDVKSFKIVANPDNDAETACAESIQEVIYETTGAYLEIKSGPDVGYQIRFIKVDNGKFTVLAGDGTLTFAYSHENMLEMCYSSFVGENIKFARGEVSLSGKLFEKDTTVIYYEDFGAVGDGKTNDFEAIYNAHKTANLGGQTVKATYGKTYYIGSTSVDGTVASATVRTNVDWCGAKFIIDDRSAPNAAIFKITSDSDLPSIKLDKDTLAALSEQKIGPGTTKIEIPRDSLEGWNGDVMLVLYSSAHKVYRRRSYSSYNGDTQKELVIIDKDGNISPETPIMFDYQTVTQVYAYRLDPSRAITVENGIFTTVTSKTYNGYITRNISISRSFTTLKNVEHYVEGEVTLLEQASGMVGAAYSAFYSVGSCTNVTLKDCVMTGRRYYRVTGTYEFSASTANKVVLDGCTQSNFWVTVDENYNITPATKDTPGAKSSQGYVNVNGTSLAICWGAGASNYCKNLEYINTQLSRLDAHAGVYNAKLIGCEITGIELCGWGTFIMEDTNWYSYGTGTVANSLIYLRNDYGSSWNGEMKIKNVNAYFTTTRANDSYLFYHSYVNWYFGHTSVFPSVEIDNLKCYDLKTKELLDAGYNVILNSNNISSASKMHLPISSSRPYFSIVDSDGDGFVDEPLFDRDLDGRLDGECDLDGNGKVGNTSISYKDAKAAAGSNISNGTLHPTSYVNLNIVKPPEYIKILNNTGKGSFTLMVKNTSGSVSNGEYYGTPENMGGFFGSTKFYYSDTEYFVGSGNVDQDKTQSFKFYN